MIAARSAPGSTIGIPGSAVSVRRRAAPASLICRPWRRGRSDLFAGDADAGAVDAVAAVDADQHRRERLGDHGVHQRAGVKAPQSGCGDQLEHRVARFGRVAGHQHVALDVMLLAQVRGADVLECRHHVHLGPDDLLCRHRGRALGRELNAGDLGRHQRHGGVDQDLARERVANGLQIGAMVGEGNGEHHDVRRRGCSGVLVAGNGRARSFGEDVRHRALRLLFRARPDDDGIAGLRPAPSESAAQVSGAADDRDPRPSHAHAIPPNGSEFEPAAAASEATRSVPNAQRAIGASCTQFD